MKFPSIFVRIRFYLFKGRSFSWIFVHADLDELGHVVGDSGGNVNPETLHGNFHAGFHRRVFCEWRLPKEKYQVLLYTIKCGLVSHLVANSQRRMAKLHMSAARVLMTLGDFISASGAVHWGWCILPLSWKLNRASAILTRATNSSSARQSI